ncbi:phenylalanine--tRNA ligase subunit alpha, partial [Acinetobacter sp. 163]|nr:phenylalanine--tRNA ligase subunit alpha [Acinetobacter sp. 163]
VRDTINNALEAKTEALREKIMNERLAAETLDVTMPGMSMPQGHLHPLTQVINDAKRIFTGLGFEVAEGPEIE